MPEFIESLTGYLQHLGLGAYWLIGLLVYLETVIVVGQFLPGSLVLALVGFLCYLQVFDFDAMLLVVFLCHYAGELTNYALGHTKGRALFRPESRYLKPSLLEAAEQRFHRGVIRIILLSQFTGFFRALIPFAAGVTRYPLWKFSLIMAVAAFLWSIIHLGIGFLVGASWQQAVGYLEGVSLLVMVVLVASLFSGWFIRKLAQHAGELGVWLESLSRRIHRSEHYQHIAQKSPRLFGFLEARLSLSRPWGMRATLGFVSSAALMLCLVLVLVNVSTSDQWRTYDLSVVNLFAQLRHPVADHVFLFFTYLGSGPVALGIALIAAGFCLRARQHKSLLVILGAVLLAMALSNVIKVTYARARPEASVSLIHAWGYSFPSGHATTAVALYGALYYWLWNHPGRVRLRVLLGFLAMLFSLLIGFSRIYLGVHFPSDVLAGFCLGGAAAILVGTVALNLKTLTERNSRADLPALGVLAIGVAAALLTYQANPQPPPRQELRPVGAADLVTSATLLQSVAREARGLTGGEVVPTNLVAIGQTSTLRAGLAASGWMRVSPGAFFTRQVRAPLFPLFIHGVPADLTMEKRSGAGRLVLRLWRTPYQLRGARTWVGTIVAEEQKPRIFGLPVYQISPDVDAAAEEFGRLLPRSVRAEFVPGFRKRGLYLWSHPFFTHGAVLVLQTPDGPGRPSPGL